MPLKEGKIDRTWTKTIIAGYNLMPYVLSGITSSIYHSSKTNKKTNNKEKSEQNSVLSSKMGKV